MALTSLFIFLLRYNLIICQLSLSPLPPHPHTYLLGSFVVRESTSVMDAFVITVLGLDQKLTHLRANKTVRGYVLNNDSLAFPSLRDLIAFYSREPIRDMHGLRLGECCLGEQLYEALT